MTVNEDDNDGDSGDGVRESQLFSPGLTLWKLFLLGVSGQS